MSNMFFVKMVIATLRSLTIPYTFHGGRFVQFTNNRNEVVCDMQTNTMRVYGGGLCLRRHDHSDIDSLILTIKDMAANPTHWRYN